ncbi:MAG: D-glycero-beta-D-manno-heptose-7-phosphate kinase [candidate division Zixibacteria bacterium]|nr:D-glycero-beta-D-manno-heptose-7-phosphate kinase [candidate division Zixibacteria bacterium]
MALSSARITEITNAMGRANVLILGDIMLDEYWHGSVDRISPEAPVPVVEVQSQRHLLGGAANVAANISALGDRPLLVGTVGRDDAADKFRKLLEDKGISGDYLVEDGDRKTTIKTRIIANSQQVVRADQETRDDLSAECEARVFDRIQQAADHISGMILSDYGKGVITHSLLKNVIKLCRSRKIYLAVDPKETRFHDYKKVSLITPNHHEAGFAFGRRIRTEADLLAVGNGLLEQLKAESILITRGAQGMSLFRVGSEPTHIPTFARHVFDVTGAGDTVIATFVSAIAAGADPVEAAVVANAGAGCTVAEVGTATVGVEQLRKELERNVKNGILTSAEPQN